MLKKIHVILSGVNEVITGNLKINGLSIKLARRWQSRSNT